MPDRSDAGESDIFWGEMSPCDHVLQLYQDDEVLLDSLEGFAAGGLRAGDAVILIATPGHLAALYDRLRAHEGLGDLGLRAARDRDQLITLDAQETLGAFMVNGWPDEGLFHATANRLLARARGAGRSGGRGRRVRAFGE